MKRYLIFAIAAIVVAMVGCKKDDTKGDAPEDIWPDAPIVDQSKIEPYTDYLISKWETPSRHFINTYLVPHKIKVSYISDDGGLPHLYTLPIVSLMSVFTMTLPMKSTLSMIPNLKRRR